MLSGRRLDLLDPSPLDIEIEDIAHGLSRVARWNGQTVGHHALSVAQHSVIVEEIARALYEDANWNAQHCMAALLHDAAEYVVGDLISPFKAALGLDYKALELNLMQAIHLRFGLPGRLPRQIETRIKQADQIAAYFEATVLAGFEEDEARRFFGPREAVPVELAATLSHLQPAPTDAAQQAFLTRFKQLQAQLDDASSTIR
ncbi:MAG: YfbR-like 5'-deoxynucleotidase [Hyphomicrobiaceae bacterium]